MTGTILLKVLLYFLTDLNVRFFTQFKIKLNKLNKKYLF